MGYIVQRPHYEGRSLLLELEQITTQATTLSREADPLELAAALDRALEGGGHEALVLYISAFLARCLAGSVPDPRDWLPPPPR